VFLEVKQPGAKATAQQQLHIDRINDKGSYAAVVCSAEEAENEVNMARGLHDLPMLNLYVTPPGKL